jgi:cytochrome P450
VHAVLPPGPRTPAPIQTIGWWTRPTAWPLRLRGRYGSRFTIRLVAQPRIVVLTDPDEIRELFTAPPDVLHPGEGAHLLEPVVGRHSVILLDGAAHMEQRKLLLPAFHGDRMQRLAGLMTELTERELDAWPADVPLAVHPRFQRLTLEIILRAVFGLDEGARLDTLRERLSTILQFGDSPVSLIPAAQRLLSGHGRFGRFERDRDEVDRHLYALMAERRAADDTERDDVLAMLLAARHEDGSPMSDEEIRDELLTALVAGHETTASSLAFAFAQLAHHPHVQDRLADDADGTYLTATIQEVMRRRPVLPIPEPRLVKRPVTIGGITYPAGTVLTAGAFLLHHDPSIYPDPFAFRPERFLERPPGTYTWIPFGGGRRRCLGAAFAQLELRLVLRAALDRFRVEPAAAKPERTRRRMITITPREGARVVLRAREGEAAPVAELPAAA